MVVEGGWDIDDPSCLKVVGETLLHMEGGGGGGREEEGEEEEEEKEGMEEEGMEEEVLWSVSSPSS